MQERQKEEAEKKKKAEEEEEKGKRQEMEPEMASTSQLDRDVMTRIDLLWRDSEKEKEKRLVCERVGTSSGQSLVFFILPSCHSHCPFALLILLS